MAKTPETLMAPQLPGASRMETPPGHSYVLPERFDRALKRVRRALAAQQLSIVDEIHPVGDRGRRILLVDCPLLVFQALALDRAASVFFPVHLLVAAEGGHTRIFWIEPAELVHGRLPAGAAEPLAALRGRITAALESIGSAGVHDALAEGVVSS